MSNFDNWWQNLGAMRRIGKIACRKSYARQVRILKMERPDVDPHKFLLDAVAAYSRSQRVKEGYVTNPLTWLNQGRYFDDHTPAEQPREQTSRMDDTTRKELARAAAIKAERAKPQLCNHTIWWKAAGSTWRAVKGRVSCRCCDRFYGYVARS